MDCSDFIARFTDYLDGVAPSEDLRAMEEHLAACASCRRYKLVLEHGSSLLRSLPQPDLREDFAPRLQHRLYHVHEEQTLSEHVASGAPAMTVLAIAILLAAVAWAPMLRGPTPVVELSPIVVDRAPPRLWAPSGSFIEAPDRAGEGQDLRIDFWGDARLYEYSKLNRRYQGDARSRQVGFATDR